MIDNTQHIKIFAEGSSKRFYQKYYVEMFNPSKEEIDDLLPFLEKYSHMLWIWGVGKVEDLPDYSFLKDKKYARVAQPFYIGDSKDNWAALAAEIRDKMMWNDPLEEHQG